MTKFFEDYAQIYPNFKHPFFHTINFSSVFQPNIFYLSVFFISEINLDIIQERLKNLFLKFYTIYKIDLHFTNISTHTFSTTYSQLIFIHLIYLDNFLFNFFLKKIIVKSERINFCNLGR